MIGNKSLTEILKLCGVTDIVILTSAHKYAKSPSEESKWDRALSYIQKHQKLNNKFKRILKELGRLDREETIYIKDVLPQTLMIKFAMSISELSDLPGNKNHDECDLILNKIFWFINANISVLDNCYVYQEQIVRLCNMLDFYLETTNDIIDTHFQLN